MVYGGSLNFLLLSERERESRSLYADYQLQQVATFPTFIGFKRKAA